jgi:hypothetical protein
MDTSAVGITTARAMERIEELVSSGRISEEAIVGACVVIVAIDRPTPEDAPNRENLYDSMTDLFVFSEPDLIYVQEGLLVMARDNWGGGSDD